MKDKLWNFENHVYILDGGMGTLIRDLGYNINDHPLWSGGANIDRPDLVTQAHEKFIQAGVDIILTNTYHSSISVIKEKFDMSEEDADNHIKDTAKLALKAVSNVGRDVKVIGSIGPYATNFRDCSEYTAVYIEDPNVTEEVLCEYYTNQMKPLLEMEFKTFAFETIPAIKEVECVLKVLEETGDDVYAWVSATCKDSEHLRREKQDEKFEDFVKLVANHPKVFAIGLNCTNPNHITALLKNGSKYANGKPFVVYPNNWNDFDGEKYIGETNRQIIFDNLFEWYKFGTRIFGGCCMVTPEDIQKIAIICKKFV